MTETNVSLGILIDRYANELWPNPTTRSSIMSHFDNLVKIIPHSLHSLTEDDYGKIVKLLQDKSFKNTTINRHMNALSKLLRHALKSGYITHVPAYKRLPENDKQLRFLNKHEEHLLFSYIQNLDRFFYQFSVLLVDTGLAPSEAINLKWCSYQKDYITVPESQKNEARTIPITKRVSEIIQELSTESGGAFNRIKLPEYQRAWRNAIDKSMVFKGSMLTPIVLRHTCAYRLIASGMDIRKVQKWLGNRDYKAMQKYEHLIDLNDFTGFNTVLEQYRD